mgnify:CR=1 FL=1
MQIEMAEMVKMAERGSSLLRLIQNSHTPLLDLLVRESIQNSTDAAKDSKTPVRYDISVKQFNRGSVARHFEGIEEKLNSRFEDEKQKSIVIRDSNTTGLTGPLHHSMIKDDKYGNLLKLVYEISMPQEKKEAGGSWGLGKTVYFRVGIGLVIYYSRIQQDDGSYQSRLAACLVEDESSPEAILPYDMDTPRRGIAWWGRMHSDNTTMPITNEREINQILDDFNVNPYTGTETGTTIIIPFIDTSKLITKTDSGNEHETASVNWWQTNIELYLNIAIQRWYAPRIDNEHYKYGNYLLPSVNSQIISSTNMEPVFSIIRTLYIAASKGIEFVSDEDRKDITVKDIQIHRSLKNKRAGSVAFLKADKEKLKMVVPYNKKSPFEYLDISGNDNGNNPPIIAYLRKPAMIVSYETEGKWTNGIDKTPEDEYIIAVFVPDSENKLINVHEEMSLDEYLRRGEKADHTSWADITIEDKKQTIVERIQKRVAQSLREAYNSQDEQYKTSKSNALSKALAKFLLPPEGFGKSPSPERKPGRKGGGKARRKKGKLNIINMRINNNGTVQMSFEIDLPKGVKTMSIEVLIDSENNQKISGNEWEDENVIGTPFPVEIADAKLTAFDNRQIENNYFDLYIEQTDKYGVKNKLCIYLNGASGLLKGELWLHNNDPMVNAFIQEELDEVKGGKSN